MNARFENTGTRSLTHNAAQIPTSVSLRRVITISGTQNDSMREAFSVQH